LKRPWSTKASRLRAAALFALQQRDGHWVFELEADATIPAEYILLRHSLAESVDNVLEAKIAAYSQLWALARYRNLENSNARSVPYGMCDSISVNPSLGRFER
jgi:Squalene-hopene cyclase N-terminal domain